MLAFGIRYLNGFVAASEPDSHDLPEWPPHPGRVFMALAAAHFETGADPAERAALEWLEKRTAPPRIRAGAASARALVTHYVPVNDRAGPAKTILQSVPALTRDRQPRTFARAWLEDEVVHIFWQQEDAPEAIYNVLNKLCAKVTRIGHSASLVQMWLASPEEVTEPSWNPDRESPEIYLRIVGPGTLKYLEECYNRCGVEAWGELVLATFDDADSKRRRQAMKTLKAKYPQGPPVRQRPELRLYAGYSRPRPLQAQGSAPGSVFGSHVVVRTLERESGSCRELDLLCVPQVVQRWREAVLTRIERLSAPAKRLLSGHDDAGAPLQGPHLAFLPMAFVGHPHAEGHLMGMGIVLPEGLERGVRREALQVMGQIDRLMLGRLGTWRICPVTAAGPWNLRADVWTAHPDGATHWSTVTPVAFDRHPKETDRSAYQREAAGMIARACVRIGLPEPRDVIVTAISAHLGVPPAYVFPKLQRKDGTRRRHTHAILVFDRPVRGPILLGAGRYRGYGACRPLASGHDS